MAGRGVNFIVYGDIQLSSDAVSIGELAILLKKIIHENGYPPPAGKEKKPETEFEEELAAIDSAIEETDEKTAWSIRGVPDGDEDRAGDDV